jgi:hypothetical protein
MGADMIVAGVTRMLTSFGPASAERCMTYAIDLAEMADCEPCVHHSLIQARHEPKQPTIRRTLEIYREMRDSDAHGFSHLGVTERQHQVSEIEAEWRGPATDAIMASTGLEKQPARYMAARLWASQAVLVREAGEEATNPVWLRSMPERVDWEALVEIAFDFARAVATKAPKDMTDAEWKELCKPWAKALSGVNA